MILTKYMQKHDNSRKFNLLDRLNVQPVIAIRNNASTGARGCQLRREEVLLDVLMSEMRFSSILVEGRVGMA